MQNKSPKTFLKLAPRSAKEIKDIADSALVTANAELQKIIAVPKKEKRTQENTLEPLNRISIALKGATDALEVFSMVHPNKKIREAAEASMRKVVDFWPNLYLRKDIYQAVKDIDPKTLDEEALREHKWELLDFKLTGAEAPPKVQREIKQLIAKSVKLGQTFERNIKDDVRYIAATKNELDGLPEDYQKKHTADAKGMIRLSTQYPDYLPFMTYAKSESARRRFYFAYTNRAWPKNEKVFKELLTVRQRWAKLLGFKDWADYVTITKMVRNGANAQKFLDRVSDLTAKQSDKDYARMVRRKQKDDPSAKEIKSWETGYYDNILTQEVIGLDSQEVREYFQFPNVKKGLLSAMGRFFGLQYRSVKAIAWHPDVEAYDVYQGKKLIGRCYFDLHPREGKYGHACCAELRPGIAGEQLPEAVLICNFSRDLMSQNEVETFFHEFGHLMHNLIGGHRHWRRFSGVETEWDFVEAPSQMLESWARDPKTLKTFARHHKTGKIIPDALIATMQKADSFNRGLWARRQIFLSALSLAYHQEKSPRTANLSTILARIEKKYSPFRYPAGVHMYANFGHLNGYSAVYYTYTWSRAIAEDILGPFKKEWYVRCNDRTALSRSHPGAWRLKRRPRASQRFSRP